VYVRDAHSNVSLALLDRVLNFDVTFYIGKAVVLSGANAIFYPDEGAMKRYSYQSELPYAFGMKKRDWKTGQIQGLDIINAEVVKDKNVLIVDDICSRGGTFYHSAKALKAAGAKSVSLYVTHCEETITLGELAASDGLVDRVYTTRSIFPEKLVKKENGYDPYWADWITILD
jgi:ribose-phosphate pyrophosphokinase